MPDDIAYWQQERAKLQQQLDELETGVVEKVIVSPHPVSDDADRGPEPAHCIVGD